jgi:hypothetical protein
LSRPLNINTRHDVGQQTRLRLAVLAPKDSGADKETPENSKVSNSNTKNERQLNGMVFTQNEISPKTVSVPKVNPTLDNHFLTVPVFSLCAALHHNARMLGISCLFPTPRISPPASDSLPVLLHPTPLQMTVMHSPYIDSLPIPKLRENLVMWNGLLDEEEFIADLIGTHSLGYGGGQSWDPVSWVIDDIFKEKWLFLFA